MEWVGVRVGGGGGRGGWKGSDLQMLFLCLGGLTHAA